MNRKYTFLSRVIKGLEILHLSFFYLSRISLTVGILLLGVKIDSWHFNTAKDLGNAVIKIDNL